MGLHPGRIFRNYIVSPLEQGTADTGHRNGSYEIHHGHIHALWYMVQSIREGLSHNIREGIPLQHHNDIEVHRKRHLDIVDSYHGDIVVDIDIHNRVFCCKLLYKYDIRHQCSVDLKIRISVVLTFFRHAACPDQNEPGPPRPGLAYLTVVKFYLGNK